MVNDTFSDTNNIISFCTYKTWENTNYRSDVHMLQGHDSRGCELHLALPHPVQQCARPSHPAPREAHRQGFVSQVFDKQYVD